MTPEEALEAYREAYKNGLGDALFEALDLCFQEQIDVPSWARIAFRENWMRYKEAAPDSPDAPNKSTLGGAFGIERPKQFTAKAERKRNLAYFVWASVEIAKYHGTAVDQALFEEIADHATTPTVAEYYSYHYGLELPRVEKKPISWQTVRDLYYGHREHFAPLKGALLGLEEHRASYKNSE